ncbi:hypothetical protein [Halovivax sp.]|nr:hypothetical protein [Halovivax sp.]
MAANEGSAQTGTRASAPNDGGVGMAHPTVVPANFDPDETGETRE